MNVSDSLNDVIGVVSLEMDHIVISEGNCRMLHSIDSEPWDGWVMFQQVIEGINGEIES